MVGAAQDDPRPLVLVVEDEVVLCDTVANELEDAGYRVITSLTGEGGLAVLQGSDPSSCSSPMSGFRDSSTDGASRRRHGRCDPGCRSFMPPGTASGSHESSRRAASSRNPTGHRP